MEYLNNISSFIDIISKIVGVIALFCVPYLKVLPLLYKLGKGLSNRKICVFSETQFSTLKDLLVSSSLFKEKNILQIHKNDMDKAKKETMFLVYWKDFASEIDYILSIKDDSTALIVYAPYEDGRIDEDNMKKISNKRNSLVVNYRGRMLNDILIFMMTTAYEKK